MVVHKDYKIENIKGRYIPPKKLTELFSYIKKRRVIGYSVLNKPITVYIIGEGEIKIFAWSQMHGNESTTTKAIIDYVHFLSSKNLLATKTRSQIQLHFIPQLNPDGAELFTRVNKNKIDLNRDAQILSQPESIALRNYFEVIQPDYAFNMHDQRSLFGISNTNYPAALSFLSPASQEKKIITPARIEAMRIISYIHKRMQALLPNRIGRYDDNFNSNCVGDTFTGLGVPTILFEAGQYDATDYDREHSRHFVFQALFHSIEAILKRDKSSAFDTQNYFYIPENTQSFFDILICSRDNNSNKDIGIRFREVLENDEIYLIPYLVKSGNLTSYYGHFTYNDISIEEALRQTAKMLPKLSVRLAIN